LISIGWPYSVRWLLMMDSYERKARPLNGLLQLRLSWYPIDVESESSTTTRLLDPQFVNEPLTNIRDLVRVVDKYGVDRPAPPMHSDLDVASPGEVVPPAAVDEDRYNAINDAVARRYIEWPPASSTHVMQ
jgi:hypothetical protein